MPTTLAGIAYDRRAGRTSDAPVVLFIHAGVADRRMWDAPWAHLPDALDLIRLDLRGFGESTEPPAGGSYSPLTDVLAVMNELGPDRVHLVGSSFGAGVAVEVVLTAPERVASLVLCPPGGSLITTVTDALRAFITSETEALDRGDMDAAVEANIDAWVVGRERSRSDVEDRVVDQVRDMQRLAFETSDGLGDVEERELEPPAAERLGEITRPTLLLTGALDMDTIHDASERVLGAVASATLVEWPDTAHLPSLERPHDFADLLRGWVARTSE